MPLILQLVYYICKKTNIRYSTNFLVECPLSSDPLSLKKVDFFRLFFTYTNRTEMQWNGPFWRKKFKIIFNMISTPFISMVVLTTKTGWPENLYYRKIGNKKNIQGMLNVFHFVWKKVYLFTGKGSPPPPW